MVDSPVVAPAFQSAFLGFLTSFNVGVVPGETPGTYLPFGSVQPVIRPLVYLPAPENRSPFAPPTCFRGNHVSSDSVSASADVVEAAIAQSALEAAKARSCIARWWLRRTLTDPAQLKSVPERQLEASRVYRDCLRTGAILAFWGDHRDHSLAIAAFDRAADIALKNLLANQTAVALTRELAAMMYGRRVAWVNSPEAERESVRLACLSTVEANRHVPAEEAGTIDYSEPIEDGHRAVSIDRRKVALQARDMHRQVAREWMTAAAQLPTGQAAQTEALHRAQWYAYHSRDFGLLPTLYLASAEVSAWGRASAECYLRAVWAALRADEVNFALIVDHLTNVASRIPDTDSTHIEAVALLLDSARKFAHP
jgi:hypothetical protein